jgi:hypothetical protein
MTSGLDRHRNKDGEISRKHGNTLVGTLRKIYFDTIEESRPSWQAGWSHARGPRLAPVPGRHPRTG